MSQLQMEPDAVDRVLAEWIHTIPSGRSLNLDQQERVPPLIPLFQELQRRSQSDAQLANRLREITIIHFFTYDFTEIPSDIDIGSLFPNLTICSFRHCPNLASFKTITGIVTLEEIYCVECFSITSLSSLSSLPKESRFKGIHIYHCDLNPTHEDDWDEAFQAIGNTTGSNDFELNINYQKRMTYLPSSIEHLKAKRGELKICLRDNPKLQRLPIEIGHLQNMTVLDIDERLAPISLPWTIGRVSPKCRVLRRVLGGSRARQARVIEQTVEDMEEQFKFPRERFITGFVNLSIISNRKGATLMEELYRPGGRGHKRSREAFEKEVNDMVNTE